MFWIIPDPLFAAAKFSRPIELSAQADKPRRKNNDLEEAARIMGTERSIRGGRKYVDAKPNSHRGGVRVVFLFGKANLDAYRLEIAEKIAHARYKVLEHF